MSVTVSQSRAARTVGLLYLATMASAVAAQICVGPLIVAGDAVRTAANVAAAASRFRLGMMLDVVTAIGIAGLIAALYVVLSPAGRAWAMFGVVLRAIETVVFVIAGLGYAVLLATAQPAPYLAPIAPAELQALGYLGVRLHGAGFLIGFVFLGWGSTMFAALWLRSRLIPRPIALWGIAASVLMAGVSMAMIVWPSLSTVVGLYHMMPLAIFEVGLGLWLVLRPLHASL